MLATPALFIRGRFVPKCLCQYHRAAQCDGGALVTGEGQTVPASISRKPPQLREQARQIET